MLISIIIFALILRLISVNQSLWLDEAIGAIAVREFSYKGILAEFMKFDNHPPLYYLALKFWSNVFGSSEIALRSLSIILGLGTIYLVFKICEIFEKNTKTAMLASLFLSTSQLHIYYSQEARMYSMAAFFATLCVYLFIRLIKKETNWLWFWFSLGLTGVFFSDYMPVFLWPIFPIYAFYKRKRIDWWIRFLISHTPLLIVSVFWLPILAVQIEKGRWLLSTLPEWSRLAGGATAKQFLLLWMKFISGRITLFNKALYYGLVTAASSALAFIFLKSRKAILSDKLFVFLWLLIPVSLGFITSFLFPAFVYFRYIYVLPAFFIILAFGVYNSEKKVQGLLSFLIIFINLFSVFIYYLNIDGLQQREQWREAVQFIESAAEDDSVVLFGYPEPFAPYLWYQTGKVEAYGATDSISPDDAFTKTKVRELIYNKSSAYTFDYLNDLSEPRKVVEESLSEEGFYQKDIRSFPGVGNIKYWQR